MAQSPAHRLGQIIGDTVEAAVDPLLRRFAETHGLFLDVHGPRKARQGKKLVWTDKFGNKHSLDYVLERNGTESTIGQPVAFIESAYRRYTKHSRNKAQEIQGAVMPLKRTYWEQEPFIGAVLAGVFTAGARQQLESQGFVLLYFPWTTVVRAFRSEGVDAHFVEATPEEDLAAKVEAWERLSEAQKGAIAAHLIEINADAVRAFMSALEEAVTRRIDSIVVIPLHGQSAEWNTVAEAIEFVADYGGDGEHQPFRRFEIQIRYSNGDRIEAQFQDRGDAIQFLESYR